MRVLQEIFFAIIIVAGSFLFRAGKREAVKVYRKYWNEGWLRWVLVAVCIFIATLGSAAFLLGAYHFAILADQAWPLSGNPVSMGTLIFAGEVFLCCIFVCRRHLDHGQGKRYLTDDDADAWPIHGQTGGKTC